MPQRFGARFGSCRVVSFSLVRLGLLARLARRRLARLDGRLGASRAKSEQEPKHVEPRHRGDGEDGKEEHVEARQLGGLRAARARALDELEQDRMKEPPNLLQKVVTQITAR